MRSPSDVVSVYSGSDCVGNIIFAWKWEYAAKSSYLGFFVSKMGITNVGCGIWVGQGGCKYCIHFVCMEINCNWTIFFIYIFNLRIWLNCLY